MREKNVCSLNWNITCEQFCPSVNAFEAERRVRTYNEIESPIRSFPSVPISQFTLYDLTMVSNGQDGPPFMSVGPFDDLTKLH